MPNLQQKIAFIPIDGVRPHPRNARQGDIGAIAESLARNGWFGSVLAYVPEGEDGYPVIVAGEHRWRALAALQRDGITYEDGTSHTYEQLREMVPLPPSGKVPVIVRNDWDDATALRVLLADNRTQDKASYDDSVLAELLTELASTDGLYGTGYDGDDLDVLLHDLDTSVSVPAQDERTVAERAQIYNEGDLRQIVLVMSSDEFERAHDILEAAMERFGVDTHSEAALAVFTNWHETAGLEAAADA